MEHNNDSLLFCDDDSFEKNKKIKLNDDDNDFKDDDSKDDFVIGTTDYSHGRCVCNCKCRYRDDYNTLAPRKHECKHYASCKLRKNELCCNK